MEVESTKTQRTDVKANVRNKWDVFDTTVQSQKGI